MNKGIKTVLVLGLCCATAAGLFGCTKAAPEETATQPATVATQPAATEADATAAQGAASEAATKTQTDTTAKPETTAKKEKEDNGSAYTVNQALDALTNYYGKGYDVSGTVSEGSDYYFAVYKNNKKYASVKVDLKTGDAVETRTKDGATANFNVFV